MLGPGVSDLDLSLDEFRNRINADLANNVANLASRAFALVARLSGPLEAAPEEPILEAARSALHLARGAYAALEYREVVRLVNDVANLCNRRMQEAKPWEDPGSPGARSLLFSVAKALRALAVILSPVLPTFGPKLADAFGQPDPRSWPKDLDPFAGPPVVAKEKPPQIARLDPKDVAKLIVAAPDAAPVKPQAVAKGTSPSETATKVTAHDAAATARPERSEAKSKGAPVSPPTFGVIQYDDFAKVELRVAQVKAVEPVPKADKLLKLSVDVGEPAPRTIVAGIAQAYPDPAQLVGKRIVVVANLAPKPLRGITSHGMLLAAGEPPNLQVVTVGDVIAPGTRVK
jgi:methionyl-tRNA synthetase